MVHFYVKNDLCK